MAELASGVSYTDPVRTSWRAPRRACALPKEQQDQIRKEWHIVVEGDLEHLAVL